MNTFYGDLFEQDRPQLCAKGDEAYVEPVTFVARAAMGDVMELHVGHDQASKKQNVGVTAFRGTR